MQKRKISLILILGVILASCLYGFLVLQEPIHQRTRKLLMPGTHHVYLVPGSYVVWYFYRWAGKKIDTESNTLEQVKLLDTNKNVVAINPFDSPVGYCDQNRAGRMVGQFTIQDPNWYVVSASSRKNSAIAIVLVPAKLQNYDLGSRLQFLGLHDDEFEPNLRTWIESWKVSK